MLRRNQSVPRKRNKVRVPSASSPPRFADLRHTVFGGGAALGDNEEKALEEASDAYDSGEEQVANSEDENFIDQEGDSDNEDYRNQVQKFEDEVPVEKVRKPSKNVVSSAVCALAARCRKLPCRRSQKRIWMLPGLMRCR